MSDTILTPPEIHIGIIGKKDNSVDYSQASESIRFAEKKILSSPTGIKEANIVSLQQVHGDAIIVMDEYPNENRPWAGEADALITKLQGLALVIRTADCVPVFMFDPQKKILAAVHSGWKGSMLNIAGKTARYMNKFFGSNLKNVLVWLLPSIGPESYSVMEDVSQYFPEHINTENGRIYLNLWNSIDDALAEAGIPRKNINWSNVCTLNRNDEYFSHRKGDSGRNLNYGFII